jgi:ketosteroid isomerase-like protein
MLSGSLVLLGSGGYCFAMPEEPTTPNLEELALALADAWSRRDFDDLVAFLAPDAIWDTTPLGVCPFQGHDAIGGAFEDMVALFVPVGVALVGAAWRRSQP